MRSFRFVSLAVLLTLLFACKAGTQNGGGEGSSVDEPEDAKTFLEFVIIESRIQCLQNALGDAGEQLKKAEAAVLAHHKVDTAWLLDRRDLADKDMQKASKAKALFEEARNSVCPGGRPDAELSKIVGGLPAAPAEAETAAP